MSVLLLVTAIVTCLGGEKSDLAVFPMKQQLNAAQQVVALQIGGVRIPVDPKANLKRASMRVIHEPSGVECNLKSVGRRNLLESSSRDDRWNVRLSLGKQKVHLECAPVLFVDCSLKQFKRSSGADLRQTGP